MPNFRCFSICITSSLLFATLLIAADSAAVLMPTWNQLPASARTLAAQFGIGSSNFREILAGIDRRTSERLREGYWDHLIFYMLQSRTFTPADPIEPARSGGEYMSS